MRLKQLTINNFGIYKDENSFYFPYSKNKKVSLIIGKNGSGKTTFLNAIKICLFGSMILKNRTITKHYENFILDKLNNEALKEEHSKFSIKGTFISQVHNYDGEFTIKRSWTITNDFTESVCIKRNGVILSQEEQISFFNAIFHAFPLDLFELFYLDGEKIDQLTVLDTNIFTLIESSINIDLFKKLRNDLFTYASKRVNNKETDQINLEMEKINIKLNSLHKSIEKATLNQNMVKEKLSSKADEIEDLKESFNINSISTDSTAIKKLELEIITLKKEIETDIIKFLPYTLVTDQLNHLLSKLIYEHKQSKNEIVVQALKSDELSNYIDLPNQSKEIKRLIDKICAFYPTNTKKLVHRLSDDDYHSLKLKVSELLKFNKEKLNNKIKELTTIENEFKSLSSNAAEVESLKSTGQIDRLLRLQSEYDQYKIALASNEESILENKTQIMLLEKDLSTLENTFWKQLKKNNVSNILDQIHNVLDEYIRIIKSNKIHEIEEHARIMFSNLIRKDGFIKDFKIENNAIYLLDKNNNRLNHSNLSAGEKQLFVLSLIYAVLQSSERRVPLMFDTLLGRLDEEHRDNVFKEFISSCPDQVIILATDSELANIDKKYLSSITNVGYLIDFSKSKNKIKEVTT